MSLDKNDKELLEQIGRKINSSPMLNGGFDKLVISVEHIREKQQESSEKLDKITQALYDPDEGLFSRMKTLEHKTENNNSEISEHISGDQKILKKIDEDILALSAGNKESQKLTETAQRLKRIAGEDLEELSGVISFRKNVSKIYWSVISLVVISVLKLLYELAKVH